MTGKILIVNLTFGETPVLSSMTGGEGNTITDSVITKSYNLIIHIVRIFYY